MESVYNETYYSACNNDYRKHFRFQVAALLRAIYIKWVFHPQAVLDVGCGMGNLVEMLRKLGIKALGIEVSDYALSQVPKNLREFFKKGSITAIPFEDDAFDVVTSVDVLEHVATVDIPKALQECARVAKRGMFHEIATLEDKRVIGKDPTHVSKYRAQWWFEQFRTQLPDWEVRHGPRIPIFKNGVFVLGSRTEG